MQKAIIVEIDGTLADNSRRSPYDMEEIAKDPVISAVKELVARAYENVVVILVSGRSGLYKPQTEARLHKHGISYHHLHMRMENDTRPNTEIKKEIYDVHLKEHYDILFAIDNRVRVVDQRREMGIYTLDCNQTRKVF